MWPPAWAEEFAVTFAPCSCSLLSGEGLSWEGPSLPGGPRHSAVSGVRQSSALFLLVQRGRPTHLQQRWQTQTRYITCFRFMYRQGKALCLWLWPILAHLCVQELSCTSPTFSQVTPASTSVPAVTSAAPTGAGLRLSSQVCIVLRP